MVLATMVLHRLFLVFRQPAAAAADRTSLAQLRLEVLAAARVRQELLPQVGLERLGKVLLEAITRHQRQTMAQAAAAERLRLAAMEPARLAALEALARNGRQPRETFTQAVAADRRREGLLARAARAAVAQGRTVRQRVPLALPTLEAAAVVVAMEQPTAQAAAAVPV